jgi:hypothetical protein
VESLLYLPLKLFTGFQTFALWPEGGGKPRLGRVAVSASSQCFVSQQTNAPTTAAHGNVTSQESKMLRTTRKSACRLVNPMPKSDPTETCVVDTGSPNKLAVVTNNPVARLAEKP